MLQRWPIAVAQVKAASNSKNVLIVCSLCQSKEIANKV